MNGAPLMKPVAEGEAPSVWVEPIRSAQMALLGGDAAVQKAALAEIDANLTAHRNASGRGQRLISYYCSLLHWTLTGEFLPSFSQLPVAKLQLWHMESQWPALGFQRAFLAHSIATYGNSRGSRLFERIYAAIDPKAPSDFFDDEDGDLQIHRRPGATTTIFGFSGLTQRYAGLGWNSFDRTIAHKMGANLIIARDFQRRLYLAGIESIGNYAQTLDRLKATLAEFADTRIVATGGSGGVFGALNLACDLELTHAICMGGPTSLELGEDNSDRQVYQKIANEAEAGQYEKPQLAEKVNASALRRIDFFVAGANAFDFAQMRDLAGQCDRVVPHVYKERSDHIVADLAVADGSLIAAFGRPL